MKEFLRECKVKKLSAGELAGIIYEHQDEIVRFYIKNGHQQKSKETITTLFDRMNSEKFLKALKKIVKSKDEDVELSLGFAVIIGDFIEKMSKEQNVEEGIVEEYTEFVKKLLKPRVKQIKKKVDLDDDVLADLLVIAPSSEFISNNEYVGIYSQKMLRKLYMLAANMDLGLTETKQVSKLFKAIFGKELLGNIAINILLEKKEYLKNFNEAQVFIWNRMTTFALDTLEKQSKDDIQQYIVKYTRRRSRDDKNQRDAARRINLTSINAEDYPKLAKVISKLNKPSKEQISKYL